MRQTFLPIHHSPDDAPGDGPKGAVYTKRWAVDLLLDLAGYASEADLAGCVAIEPAAGEGAFLAAMARRLVDSARAYGRPVMDCASAIIAYEINGASAVEARASVVRVLSASDIPRSTASDLASAWVHVGDYLLDADRLPAADFVVGNPPYVRLEDIPATSARLYRAMYPTMTGRADMYVAFFEAALRQLKPGAVCAFLCADRWMLNQYGAELRRLVTGGYGVEAIVEMHDADAFDEEVSAYPAITVIRRGPQGRAVVASVGRLGKAIGAGAIASGVMAARSGASRLIEGLQIAAVEDWFSGGDPWPCGSPARLALVRHLEREFQPLESCDGKTRVGIGVATGLDAVFLTSDPALVEATRLLPLAMVGDIVDGRLRTPRRYLVNPWDDAGLVDLASFPRLDRYLERHRVALAKRHTARKSPDAWYRTIDRVNPRLLDEPKLYIPDIKDRLEPVLDGGGSYPHHNLYFITSDGWDLEVLGGLLLSSVAQAFVEAYGVRMRGGYLRFQAQYLRRIRVPDPRAISGDQASDLIRAFRTRDRGLADRVASQVYGLDPLEVARVD